MTKQTKQEWREKFEKMWQEHAQGKAQEPTNIPDFFYSLHLQEVEKIREIVESKKYLEVSADPAKLVWKQQHNRTLDEILLAITDEK